jgi:hypothetical protein
MHGAAQPAVLSPYRSVMRNIPHIQKVECQATHLKYLATLKPTSNPVLPAAQAAQGLWFLFNCDEL